MTVRSVIRPKLQHFRDLEYRSPLAQVCEALAKLFSNGKLRLGMLLGPI
jgi:hypothetical protein